MSLGVIPQWRVCEREGADDSTSGLHAPDDTCQPQGNIWVAKQVDIPCVTTQGQGQGRAHMVTNSAESSLTWSALCCGLHPSFDTRIPEIQSEHL